MGKNAKLSKNQTEVLDILDTPMDFKEVTTTLGVPPVWESSVKDTLNSLIKRGKVVQDNKKRYVRI